MEREIKFRAWNGIGMEYNVMAGFLGAFYVQGIDQKDSACMSPFNTLYSKQTPVMQNTGLHDKNGKEIYEGDIIRNDNGTILRIYFDNLECGFRQSTNLKDPYFRDNDYNYTNMPLSFNGKEVIGNIYENPELIK